jgi:hypothetical protein
LSNQPTLHDIYSGEEPADASSSLFLPQFQPRRRNEPIADVLVLHLPSR